jgi:hypothetical protein
MVLGQLVGYCGSVLSQISLQLAPTTSCFLYRLTQGGIVETTRPHQRVVNVRVNALVLGCQCDFSGSFGAFAKDRPIFVNDPYIAILSYGGPHCWVSFPASWALIIREYYQRQIGSACENLGRSLARKDLNCRSGIAHVTT